MATLRISSSGFGGVAEIEIGDLATDKVLKIMPVLQEVVLGIPMPAAQPVVVGSSPFATDLGMLRLVITQTYHAAKAGLSTHPNKINMIKFVRSVTNIGLKEAKDFVDGCEASVSYVSPQQDNVAAMGKFLDKLFNEPEFSEVPASKVIQALEDVFDISAGRADDLYWDNYHKSDKAA